MSTVDEQIASLKKTKEFLYDLLTTDKYPKTKKEMRERASYCLKHFPSFNINEFIGCYKDKDFIVEHTYGDALFVRDTKRKYYASKIAEDLVLFAEYRNNKWYSGYINSEGKEFFFEDKTFKSAIEAAVYSVNQNYFNSRLLCERHLKS